MAGDNTFFVKLDDGQLANARELLNPKQYRSALWSTVQRATSAGKKVVADHIARELLAKKSAISEAVSTRISRGDEPSGTITVSKRLIPLTDFKGCRGTKRGGVWVRTVAGKPRLTLRHAFIATMRSGHKGVFIREKIGAASMGEIRALGTATASLESRQGKIGIRKKGRYRIARVTPEGYSERLPVQEVFGPSAWAIAGQPATTKQIVNDLRTTLMETLQKRLQSQFQRFGK